MVLMYIIVSLITYSSLESQFIYSAFEINNIEVVLIHH
jgi:hypothetical protein